MKKEPSPIHQKKEKNAKHSFKSYQMITMSIIKLDWLGRHYNDRILFRIDGYASSLCILINPKPLVGMAVPCLLILSVPERQSVIQGDHVGFVVHPQHRGGDVLLQVTLKDITPLKSKKIASLTAELHYFGIECWEIFFKYCLVSSWRDLYFLKWSPDYTLSRLLYGYLPKQ